MGNVEQRGVLVERGVLLRVLMRPTSPQAVVFRVVSLPAPGRGGSTAPEHVELELGQPIAPGSRR